MTPKQESRLNKFKEKYPEFKAQDFFKFVLKDLDKEVDVKWLNRIAVAFNYVASQSIEGLDLFNVKRKYSYRSIKKIFKLKDSFTLEQVKYLVRVMYSSTNNESESWINTDACVALVEYAVVCCSDEVEAVKQFSKLPHTTINESMYNQEHLKWQESSK